MFASAMLLGLGCGKSNGDGPEAPAQPDPGQPAQPDPDQPDPGQAPSGPAPTEPGEPGGAPTTPQECEAMGGTFVASIGGETTCPAGKRSIGAIRHGIEGGLCCK